MSVTIEREPLTITAGEVRAGYFVITDQGEQLVTASEPVAWKHRLTFESGAWVELNPAAPVLVKPQPFEF